jgi:hypothetical protein
MPCGHLLPGGAPAPHPPFGHLLPAGEKGTVIPPPWGIPRRRSQAVALAPRSGERDGVRGSL